jgi:hydrogenase-4 component F
MMTLLIVVPLACAAAALLAPPRVGLALNALAALAALAGTAALAHGVLGGAAPATALGGTLRGDELGVLVALVVAAAAAVAGLVAVAELGAEPVEARRHAVLMPALLAALLATALADDLGVMWITMELAAVLAAFLIGSHRGRPAVEAAFKYMLLGSAGLVLGLLATAVLHRAGGPLSFVRLRAAGSALAPPTVRIALALAVAGYGLKVGLFPLHVWKPDAYAAARAPVTALLAGAAVAVPLGAMVRFGAIATAAGQGALTGQLFVAAGALSLVAALILVAGERDLRRILAFTSVEHMGLALLALGLEPEAVRGGLYHLFTNGVLKALVFGLTGFVVRDRGSADTLSGPGLYGRSFGLAGLFLVAMAAALGFPPFGLFASEVAVLRALFAGGHVALALLVTGVLAGVFGVVAAAALRVVFARADEDGPRPGRAGAAAAVTVPVLALMAWLGVGMPESLWASLLPVAQRLAP